MKLFIVGICGTFMGSLARLAKALGHEVIGSDANVYPPMSTQLLESGIQLCQGFDAAHIPTDVDEIIIGNVASRGNRQIEYILNNKIPYTSGPEWLRTHILKDKTVVAVSGTHGKTTTTSMIAWILHYAKLNPSFLIGGVPNNFSKSAMLSSGKYFVIEADEYDTAFFDKRAKFMHYHPDVLVINNIEYDHADIYDDLNQIKKAFQHLLRTVPAIGTIIFPAEDKNIQDVFKHGVWSKLCSLGNNNTDVQYNLLKANGSKFEINMHVKSVGVVNWPLTGLHNVYNATAAIGACCALGVSAEIAIAALNKFKGVKKRMECFGKQRGIKFYEDFAHHPTAIKLSLDGMVVDKKGRIIVALDFASNTMKMGTHRHLLADSLKNADEIICYKNEKLMWPLEEVTDNLQQPYQVCKDVDAILDCLKNTLKTDDTVILMSNGAFAGLKTALIQQYNLEK